MEGWRNEGWACGVKGDDPAGGMERVCRRRRDVRIGKSNSADCGNLACLFWAGAHACSRCTSTVFRARPMQPLCCCVYQATALESELCK